MTILNYKIVAGYGEIESHFCETDKDVRFRIDGIDEGLLIIGNLVLTIKNGECRGDLSRLDEGKLPVIASSSFASYTLEPLTKSQGRISISNTENWVVRKLLSRVESAEKEIELLNKKYKSLEETVSGYRLFD